MKKFFFSMLFLFGGSVFLIFSPKEVLIERSKNLSSFEEEKVILKDSLQKENFHFLPSFLFEAEKKLIERRQNFIKVDLKELKIYLYKDGEIFKKFPILAIGKKGGWGQTPVGFFKVLSKNELAFSQSEELFMPYAINFWGKYFIHGPPYFPDKTPFNSQFSAGCIRLKLEDAKFVFNFAEIGMPVLIMDKEFEKDNFSYQIKNQPNLNLSAQSYLVADLENNFVFLQKDIEKKMPIASVIKLLTALTVVENVNLKKKTYPYFPYKEKLEKEGWFKPSLKENQKYSVVELLYLALIPSANDAAFTLTQFLGKEKTIELMKERAISLGMEDTEVFEPSGLGELINSNENLSSAKDLFYLIQYISFVQPLLLEITKGGKVQSFGNISFDISKLKNKNMFEKEENFLGGKTGYTTKAGDCGVFVFKIKNKEGKERKIAIILLKARSLKGDVEKILSFLKKEYFE
jgi:D-alanyl-D-alanine carboxypeptidase